MVSRENRVILFSILVLLPLTLLLLRGIRNWFDFPLWIAGIATVVVAVVLPQWYLGYSSR